MSKPICFGHVLDINAKIEVRFEDDGMDVLVNGELAISFVSADKVLRMVQPHAFHPDPIILREWGAV